MSDSWACFSEDRKYRYRLTRRLGASSRRLLFIMLNPSKADETQDDATIRRCIGFARSWGFGTLEVVNLFALMATHPAELRRAAEPVGKRNDYHISAAVKAADRVICAWGNHGSHMNRAAQTLTSLRHTAQLCHIGLNKSGEPRHPLLIPKSATPIGWHPAEITAYLKSHS